MLLASGTGHTHPDAAGSTRAGVFRWFSGVLHVLGEDAGRAAWPGGAAPQEAPAAMTAARIPLLLSLLFSTGPHLMRCFGLG